jgi:hypothetical protein
MVSGPRRVPRLTDPTNRGGFITQGASSADIGFLKHAETEAVLARSGA